MSITAMKQALEALEIAADGGGVNFHAYAKELRQAIAEKQDGVCQHCAGKGCVACDAREQEPVAIDPLPRACNLAGVDYQTFLKIKAYMPVHTHPQRKREWIGLTDDEIQTVVNKVASGEYQYSDTFARAIEAKLKEKNHA